MRMIAFSCAAAALLGAEAHAQIVQPDDWVFYEPTNTGVPGDFTLFGRVAPDGRLWVSARDPFHFDGGIGVLDRETGLWETYANWQSPIPTQWNLDLEFDALGVAWITGQGGLIRFDGNDDWHVYTPANSELLYPNTGNVTIAPNGHIWFNNGTGEPDEAMLYEFDGEGFIAHDEVPFEDPWLEPGHIFADSAGGIWLTNASTFGLWRYDGQDWVDMDVGLFRPRDFDEDAEGKVWMVDDSGVRVWDGQSLQSVPGGGNVDLTYSGAIRVAPNGDVYVGTDFGELYKYSGGFWSVVDLMPSVYDIDIRESGHVWVTTSNTVRHYVDDVVVEGFNAANTGLPWDSVSKFYNDNDGDIWFSMFFRGAAQFDGEAWRCFNPYNFGAEPWPWSYDTNYGSDTVGAVWQDPDGLYWIGSNGVATFDGEDIVDLWTHADTPGFGVWLVTAFGMDANGDVWMGTDGYSVRRFTGDGWTPDPDGAPAMFGDVVGIQTDGNGVMWVASQNGGFHAFDGVQWTSAQLPVGALINDMHVEPNGTVWLATAKGIQRFQDGEWTVLTPANTGLPHENIQAIDVRASDGLLAVSSLDFIFAEGGLALFDGESWETYTPLNSPLPHFQVEAVHFDPDGNLWVSPYTEGIVHLQLGGACAADVNADGQLTILDFIAYQNLFVTGDPAADMNGDGELNILDFVAYQTLFQQGCD